EPQAVNRSVLYVLHSNYVIHGSLNCVQKSTFLQRGGRCPVNSDYQRASRAEQVNGAPGGRRPHKSKLAMFGVLEIRCIGGTALVIFSATSVTVNTLKLSSPAESTECVSGTSPNMLRPRFRTCWPRSAMA